jgi:hypothetical protein
LIVLAPGQVLCFKHLASMLVFFVCFPF